MADALETSGDIGSILGIWGHPDDEAWLSAGLMMHAVDHGRAVTCVTATKGESGFPDDDPRTPAERAAVRETELAACLEVLGVTDHRWLDYSDGGCSQVPDQQAVGRLVEIIREVEPDTVLCFGPDGATGHSDHIATCRWTTRAVERAGLPGTRLLYATKTDVWVERFFEGVDRATIMMTDELDIEVVDVESLAVKFTCDDTLVARKVEAMRAQASQLEALVQATGLEAFTELVREEFFRAPLPTDPALMERARLLGKP